MDATINLTQSNSSNVVETCYNLLFQYVGLTIFLTTIYAIVIIIGLVGNTLIIYIVINKKSLRSSTNLFLVNMAVCDIGLVCFMVPKKISEVFIGQWGWLIPGKAGLVLCKLVPFIHDVFINCSTYSLLLITFDRFCAVLFPHKRWLTSKVVIALVVFTWVGSVVINAVLIKKFSIIDLQTILYCVPIWSSRDEFLAYTFTWIIMNILLPMIVIPTAYTAIFRKLKKQCAILAHSISEQQKIQEALRQKKIVYMAFAIVCCFAVIWLLFALQMILRFTVFLNYTTMPCWFLRFHEVSFYFLVLVSVTNPVICFTFNSVFKDQLKVIYRRVCYCKKIGGSETTTTNQIEMSKAGFNGPGMMTEEEVTEAKM